MFKVKEILRFARGIRKRETTPEEPLTLRGGSTVAEIFSQTLSPAMSVSTVYRCVSLLSDSVANLPVRYMRMKNGTFVEDTDSRLSYLLGISPDPSVNAFDFWKRLTSELLLTGNTYVVPVYSTASGDYERLVLCSRNTVAHDTTADTYTVNDPVMGIRGTYSAAEIIHIMGMPGFDPKTGLSVIGHARRTLDIATVADRETYNRFENGGDVRGLIGNDNRLRGMGEYQDAELQKTARNIDRLFRNGDRIVSLPGDISWKQLSMSSADMQFLESRKFTVLEICRFFGVHPSFVFSDTSSNYKSAEMANVAFLSNTLNPLLRRIELEFRRKLFPESLWRKRKVEFDRRALYACDLESKANYISRMIGAGMYTVNEARASEGLPPVEGGDKVLVSANLKGIEELGQPSAAPEPQQ